MCHCNLLFQVTFALWPLKFGSSSIISFTSQEYPQKYYKRAVSGILPERYLKCKLETNVVGDAIALSKERKKIIPFLCLILVLVWSWKRLTTLRKC